VAGQERKLPQHRDLTLEAPRAGRVGPLEEEETSAARAAPGRLGPGSVNDRVADGPVGHPRAGLPALARDPPAEADVEDGRLACAGAEHGTGSGKAQEWGSAGPSQDIN